MSLANVSVVLIVHFFTGWPRRRISLADYVFRCSCLGVACCHALKTTHNVKRASVLAVGRTKRRSTRACILRNHTTTVTIVHHLRVLVVASHLRSLSLSRSQDLKSCDQTMIPDQMYFCVPDAFHACYDRISTISSRKCGPYPSSSTIAPFPMPSRFASTCGRTSRPLCHHPMTRIIDFCCLLLTPRHFLVLLV